jgi:hypothetical protein
MGKRAYLHRTWLETQGGRARRAEEARRRAETLARWGGSGWEVSRSFRLFGLDPAAVRIGVVYITRFGFSGGVARLCRGARDLQSTGGSSCLSSTEFKVNFVRQTEQS